jgi:opacity protein-like surface antigen
MKKIIASAGLVAVSAAGLQAAAPGLSPMEASKPWSISATLRGFYDDNYTSVHKSVEDDSFGIEVRPAIGLNFPFEQSFVGVGYVYSLKWYEGRSEDTTDQSHELTLRADHRFSERYSVDFDESFVYSQEPAVVDDVGFLTAFQRTDADAMRNRARIGFDAQLTELIGMGLGYQNSWYDYDQDGPGSRSALLDRWEHDFNIEGRWHARENLFASLGYGLGIVSYTGDDVIAGIPDPLGPPGSIIPVAFSEDRDSISHRVYVGAEQAVSSQFRISAKIGGEYTDYHEVGDDNLTPWAEIAGTYNYLPGSYLQFGFQHGLNATDRATPTLDGDDIVLDQESSSLFGSLTHRITPRLDGSVIGRVQRSEFNEGGLDGDIDNMVMLGLNLEYRFTPNWSTEVGYNYDRLDSDVRFRSFTRNRVYAGVRATY